LHKRKLRSVTVALAALALAPLSAQAALDLSMSGGVFLPMQSGEKIVGNGEAGAAIGEIKLGKLPLAGRMKLGYGMVPINSAAATISLLSLGAYAGPMIDSLPRIRAYGLIGGGGYWGTFNSTQYDLDGEELNPQSGGGALLGGVLGGEVFLTPSSGLRIEGDYSWYIGLLQSVSLSLGYVLHLDGLTAKTSVEDLKADRYFPSLMGYYAHKPIATFSLVNRERFPISNVLVSFTIPGIGSKRSIALNRAVGPRESLAIALLAPETSEVAAVEAAHQERALIEVDYRVAGVVRRVLHYESFQVQSKNAIVWDDDAKAAAFVAPTAPEVLNYAKATVPIVHGLGYPTANKSIKTALGVFSYLGSLGLSYCVNPNLPSYEEASKNVNIVDSIQFPGETISYRSGNCSDLSVLYASLLESLGIETAFITVPGHIFIAFAAGATVQDADAISADERHIIVQDGRCWIPVEATQIGSSFADAVDTGAKEWIGASIAGTARFLPVHNAWKIYPPAAFSTEVPKASAIDSAKATQAAMKDIDDFFTSEIRPQETALKREISTSDSKSRLRNKLGLLYIRYGFLDKARDTFLAILQHEKYYQALINLGNIAVVDRDYEAALKYYASAEELKPESLACAYAIAKTLISLSRLDEARKYVDIVRRSDPSSAAVLILDEGDRHADTRSADIEDAAAKLRWAEE